MRLSEYLEVSKKLKQARIASGYTQKEMAKELAISNSAYSNYENGYSEPPVEILEKFCYLINIDLQDLLELKLTDKRPPIVTFTDFMDDLLEIERIGLKINYSMRLDSDRELRAIYTFDSPQLATMGSGIDDLREKLANKKLDEQEYKWELDTLRSYFNVKIRDFLR